MRCVHVSSIRDVRSLVFSSVEISLDMVRRAETVTRETDFVLVRRTILDLRDQSLLYLFRCVSEFTGHTPHNSHEPDELGRKITEFSYA